MKNILSLLLFSSLLFAGCQAPEQKTEGEATPESLGISSQAILNFIEAAEKERKDELHSFMLLRHGKIAAQGWWNPYNPESPHMLFSLSKSFTSTAIGMAQAEGLLNINDKVTSFFPDETPKDPSKNLQAMRIRDLLTMNTGHNDDATGGMQQDTASWVKGFLSLPVEHKPGTHFVYNSAATYMLSAILQKTSGKTLLEYLTPRLFEPLGIEHPTWDSSPQGINIGGWGLKIRTKDIAQLGQLYLQKGMWQGKQLIPEAWVEEATKKQTSNGSNPDSDWEQGYGYQFWRCRHDLFRGDGAFGQYCIVFPKQDAVLAITSGTKDMGAIMNLVWDHLLPALSEKPVAENKDAFAALQTKLKSLSLSAIKGDATSPKMATLSSEPYTLESNQDGITSLAFQLKADDPSLTFTTKGKTFNIPFGNGALKNGTYYAPPSGDTPVASSGAWISPDTLRVRTYFYETPFYVTNDIAFDKNNVTIVRSSNVNFGPTNKVEFKGTRK
ncbi:serine hydrolase domain-containing protein [Chryseolinea soli]|uniref:Class C beta-lactamase-related serine hydrolase n=1 Tax=Chryseolinea soli TaxID=2321403 RepID=A0A385SW67_9BACT|nr:serine hydrolase [Chryseolinea soli]AYB35072.1 class C beta-lactamase-related serine hydrolase [Chryseolinea soli]